MDRASLLPPLLSSAKPAAAERMSRFRLMLLALTISLWALVIVGRLVQLQVLGRDGLRRLAARQSERTINLDPRRGSILDRERRPLAVSVDAESVYAVPQDIEDPRATAAALSQALGLDPAGRKELLAQLQRSRAFVWVKRKVDPATARAVRDLQLDGVGFLAETRRYYPQRELAAQVVGYVGLDNTGMSGIEYAFENAIRGRAAKVVVHTDALRRPVGHSDKPSTEGHSVVLTIDETVQYIAETELERAMGETGSIAGTVVVMEPRTGEILAMANRPTFNPNRFRFASSDQWRNRAVVDAYEPGSIFKIITAAAGLEQKVVDADEVIDCGHGQVEIAGQTIHDHAIFDQLTFRQVMAHSSDIGVIRVAQRLGQERFERYVRSFGFGEPTGVELPGESRGLGLLRAGGRWSPVSLASMSFGQEVGVTALQMTAAVGAVANGGYLMKPQIVRRVEDAEGGATREVSPIAVRRVLNPSTVDVLTDIMKGVVRQGTGRRAALSGYAVAGKTGTAQKIDPATGRYSMVDHVASFVGFVPASRPALVILVSLDTPKGPHNEGGDVAAPVFARVAEQALRRLAVPPDDPDRVLRASASPMRIVPASASAVADVSLAVTGSSERGGTSGGVPSMIGLSAREAAVLAARYGLMVELQGSGRVVAQVPEAGHELEPGLTCQLSLAPGLSNMPTVVSPVPTAADARMAEVAP
jgi:cell division protein FtsI (penicillin-binding protein 3)